MRIVRLQVSLFVCVCGMLAALVAQPVQAAEGTTYLRFDVGPSWVNDITVNEVQGQAPDVDLGKFKLNTGMRFDLAFGVNLSRVFALELEANVLYNTFDSRVFADGGVNDHFSGDSLWQVPVMLNGVFTLLPNAKIHPYLGVGVGGIMSVTPAVVDSDSYTLAYQFMLGVKYELTQKLEVGLSYKLLGSFRHNRLLGDFTTDYITNNSLVAALTLHF